MGLDLPKPLGPEDRLLYREIFALQEKGLWRAADRHIDRLGDRVLLGHVMAQRYLHPTKYRSKFSELKHWLSHYADHPDAPRIFRLALYRKPDGAANPDRPRFGLRAVPRAAESGPDARPLEVRIVRSRAERRLRRLIGRWARREWLTKSENYLARASVERRFGAAAIDRTRALIAAGWFRRGNDERAYRIAELGARRSGAKAPRAHWWAGLAAYRLGRHATAARHFAAVADSPRAGARLAAAASFWAARAHLVGGAPEKVNPWLARAAAHPRTFYGMIAARLWGAPSDFDWYRPAVDASGIEALGRTAPGRRVFALLQVGQIARAERELRGVRPGASPELLRTIIAVADRVGLAATALRAGRTLEATAGEQFDSALYPVPRWRPEGGFAVDRALIYALARQESSFNTRAKSRSGARGIMQLLPSTARFMAGSRHRFRGNRRVELYDPETNITLGQKYVSHLLSNDVVAGNLIMMIAAYNGGPGNLAKWQSRVRHGSDPLVFIESIPLRETRLHVKRVLENLWAYRARLGQAAPSLDALAAGRWPIYVGLDGARLGVAERRP